MQANFTNWDYGFLKIYGLIPGLILGAFFPAFVKEYLWVFVAIFLILLTRYLYLLFVKKEIYNQ
jgi:hypothetical protein